MSEGFSVTASIFVSLEYLQKNEQFTFALSGYYTKYTVFFEFTECCYETNRSAEPVLILPPCFQAMLIGYQPALTPSFNDQAGVLYT